MSATLTKIFAAAFVLLVLAPLALGSFIEKDKSYGDEWDD